jgi:sugar lactone lactonase YvrE
MKTFLSLISFFIVPLILQAQVVTTLAGSGLQGSKNGTSANASFYEPCGMVIDSMGNVFLAEGGNNDIRKISTTGMVSTWAGSGAAGGTDGTKTGASFSFPSGLAIDSTQNLYVADQADNKIRKISPAGVVSTLAGSGYQGSTDAMGALASFNYPADIVRDAKGNLFVVETYNNKIRKISPSGLVSTFAGSGASGSTDGNGLAASFNQPVSLAIDGSGNLYVAEAGNNKIRKVTPDGQVSTLAGSGSAGNVDATGTAASFNLPQGMAVDNVGNVYVADYFNNKIRKISPAGIVSTFAGSGTAGSANGIGTAASFYHPVGVALDKFGNIFVSDYGNYLIRKITPSVVTDIMDQPNVEIGLSVFPNPSNGNLSLRYSKEETFSLINHFGQTVQSIHVQEGSELVEFQVGGAAGIYILQANANPSLIRRIVVTK